MQKSILVSSDIGISYHLQEQEFEGPLDLLLSMISDSKINIRDIFISNITQQYLAYVSELVITDYEYASDFISMASSLLEIKSKSLLPKVEYNYDESLAEYYTDENTEENLYRKLEEYKLYKEVSEKLRETEQLNRFYREPAIVDADVDFVVKNFDLDSLVIAFSRLMDRFEHEPRTHKEPKTIAREPNTVANKISYITALIRQKKKICIFDLFENCSSKLDIINTFLAVLEILKKQVARAEQYEAYGNISLFHSPETDIVIEQEEIKVDAQEYN